MAIQNRDLAFVSMGGGGGKPANSPSSSPVSASMASQVSYNMAKQTSYNTTPSQNITSQTKYNMTTQTQYNMTGQTNYNQQPRVAETVYKIINSVNYNQQKNTNKLIQESIYKMINDLNSKNKVEVKPPVMGETAFKGSGLIGETTKVLDYVNLTQAPGVTLLKPLDNEFAINEDVDEEDISTQKLNPKYFTNSLSQVDRRKNIQTYNLEYLNYLFFTTNINVTLIDFYNAVDNKISENKFEEEETSYDEMDLYLLQHVFTQVWNAAKSTGSSAVKNTVGFFIYFNHETNFFATLIQGMSVNDFLTNMSIASVLDNLRTLGLYPVRIGNLFNQLWYSFKMSSIKDQNKAEVKMSINEFYNYRINRLSAATFSGMMNRKNKLRMKALIDISKNSNRTFPSYSLAFNEFKSIINRYNFIQGNKADDYLKGIVPGSKINDEGSMALLSSELNSTNRDNTKEDTIFMNNNLLVSRDIDVTDKNIWNMMETFDTDYKINVSYINKGNMEKLFKKFSNDISFPLGTEMIAGNYITFWKYWLEFLNAYVNKIDVYDYDNIYENMIEIVNVRFIIKYLTYNEAFKDYVPTGETTVWNPEDGDNYVLAKLQTIYKSLDELKKRTQELLKKVRLSDKARRFYLF